MDERQELDKLHGHWHEIRKAVDHSVITIAVVQERQKAQGDQMDRIEASLRTCNGLLLAQNGRLGTAEIHIAVLEDRAEQNSLGIVAAARAADAAKTSGATMGAVLGGFAAAVISGLAALFGVGK